MYHAQHLPYCLYCHPHSYIRMVQHLIERCLLLHMNMDQCARALSLHASIDPLVTLTVWKELMRENRGFFHAYFQDLPSRPQPYKPVILQKASRIRRRYHHMSWIN